MMRFRAPQPLRSSLSSCLSSPPSLLPLLSLPVAPKGPSQPNWGPWDQWPLTTHSIVLRETFTGYFLSTSHIYRVFRAKENNLYVIYIVSIFYGQHLWGLCILLEACVYLGKYSWCDWGPHELDTRWPGKRSGGLHVPWLALSWS